MELHTFSKEQLEDVCDRVKAVILDSLAERIMPTEDADFWCRTHTIILRKQSVFRTFVSKSLGKEEDKELKFIVVEKK